MEGDFWHFFAVVITNQIIINVSYFKDITFEIVLASLGVAFYLSIIECLVIIPNGIFLYININKATDKNTSITFKHFIIFIVWVFSICMSSYTFSHNQVSKLKQYELINVADNNKVVVAKYQDMFYTYNCEINGKELIIYTDESEMFDMRNTKVKKIDFEKVTIK